MVAEQKFCSLDSCYELFLWLIHGTFNAPIYCYINSFKLSLLTLLKTFFILITDIADIPDDIKYLASLQIADFSSNPIPRLPVGFSQLKSLTVLGLNDMSLTSLPDDFGW